MSFWVETWSCILNFWFCILLSTSLFPFHMEADATGSYIQYCIHHWFWLNLHCGFVINPGSSQAMKGLRIHSFLTKTKNHETIVLSLYRAPRDRELPTIVPDLYLASEDREPPNRCPWFISGIRGQGATKPLSLILYLASEDREPLNHYPWFISGIREHKATKPLSLVYIWHQRTESHQTVVPGLYLASEDKEPPNRCPWFMYIWH